MLDPTPPAWLQPVSDLAPCGPSLEYDAAYAVLVARLQSRGEAQYGDFIGASDTPDWPEIERQCRELLSGSRDINLLVWLCRARVRATQACGLAQGLQMLADVLERWPEHVHPQLWIDGEHDPAVRANALAALCDPEGLLGDIRELALSSNTLRLLVRDVERAFAIARGADATPQAQAVHRQLHALREQTPHDPAAAVHRLAHAARSARRIDQWCAAHLQDAAPPLQALLRLLEPFDVQDGHEAPAGEDERMALASALQGGGCAQGAGCGHAAAAQIDFQSRSDAQHGIRAARLWFENHEPSSPVAVLLKQAERLVGQRFADVVDAIPLELLRQWDDGPGDDARADA